MNRKQNLINSLKENPESLSLSQIETILNFFNFKLQKKTSGSHYKYRFENIVLIISPHNGKIKNYQKKQIKRMLQDANLI